MWNARSFKHSETTSNVTFLHSIYHHRAGKTNLFHMRGGRSHAGPTSKPVTLCGGGALVAQGLHPTHTGEPLRGSGKGGVGVP